MALSEIFDRGLETTPVMAILRGFSPEESVTRAIAAWNRGVELVEVPIQDQAGREALRAVAAEAKTRDRRFGARTVLTRDDLHFAHDVGCTFTVAPGLNIELSREATRRGIAHLPGVATASEISVALAEGISWLKAFPARELSPSWIAAQLGPFPTVRFVATGGVDSSNAQLFLDSGAAGVGVGNAITDPTFDPQALRRSTERRTS